MGTLPSEDLHVLIIGAGITGLLLAQKLKMTGIKFSIFEAESSPSSYRPREWTMGIHWSLPMLQSILPEDIWNRLNTAQPDPAFEAKPTDTLGFHNGKTGELLKALPSGGMRRFSRGKLRSLCSEGIEVIYGKKLSSVTFDNSKKGVTAHFSDGTTVEGDTLIGADGPRSKVRDIIFGEEKAKASSADVTLAVVISRYTADQAIYLRKHASLITMAFHPSGTFTGIFGQDFSSSDPEAWEFLTMHSSMPPDFRGNDLEKLKLFRERVSEYVDPWKGAIHWIPEGTRVSFNNLAYWKTQEFDNMGGRVTLAGDAAHPMTPQRGQGLNHAICDVMHLAEALHKVSRGQESLGEAMKAYDIEMVKRGAEEVQAALVNTKMIHDWDTLMHSPLFAKSVNRDN